jgi:hypothetical protein
MKAPDWKGKSITREEILVIPAYEARGLTWIYRDH